MTLYGILKNKNKLLDSLLFVVFFLGVLSILHRMPLTIDDFGFQNIVFSTNQNYLDYVLSYGNGRILGNGGAIFLVHHLLLSDVVRALVIAGMAIILPKVLRIHGPVLSLLSMTLLLGVSPRVFGETFSWMSGFQNYVPPVFLFFVAVFLIQKGRHKSLIVIIVRYTLVFLCGICMQLYIEHSSCLNCLASFVFTIHYYRKNRESFTGGLLLTIGNIIGLLIMLYLTFFNSPIIFGNKESYFLNERSIFNGVLRNAVILSGMYTENALQLGLLTVLLLYSVYKVKAYIKKKTVIIICVGLIAPSLLFTNSLISGLSPWYGRLAVAESSVLSVGFLCYLIIASYTFSLLVKITSKRNIKLAGLMFCTAVICIVPLLFVWPTGYRCLFHSIVMLDGAILLLTRELIIEQTDEFCYKMLSVAAVSFITIVVCLSAVFSDIRKMVSIRDDYLVTEAKTGSETAAYFMIPSPYIHDYWDEEFEHTIVVKGKELKLVLLPADVWFQTNYYHYS